jgi:hypothetical protein
LEESVAQSARRFSDGFKEEAPSSKLKAQKKLQTPNPKFQHRMTQRQLELETWFLELLLSFELGGWNFELGASAPHVVA